MKKLLLCSLLLIFPTANTDTNVPTLPIATLPSCAKVETANTNTNVSTSPNGVKVELDRQQNSQKFAQCGTKKKCGQMNNCDEAYHFLKKCGLTRLDRDKDSIPCETICGKRRR